MSTGGGSLTQPRAFELMKASGCLVYLRTDIGTLMERLAKAPDTRPLLSEGLMEEHLQREKLQRITILLLRRNHRIAIHK